MIIPYTEHKVAIKIVGLKKHVSPGISAFLSIYMPLFLSENQLKYNRWNFNFNK